MPIINPDLPADGETADAADVNDVFNAILAVINGGIDSDNMAANSVGTSELVDGSVTEPKLAAATRSGWYSGMTTPNTVTYNGNRSYTLVFNTVDYTGIINPGTRLRLTRSVSAPTQCTSLNGSSQYWVKTSPNKSAFTDDWVAGAWVKLAAYPSANGAIIGRYNGTSGWVLQLSSTGQAYMYGLNAGAGNYSEVHSLLSLPLNKWTHIAAQSDMSTFTATTTTSYMMFDGVDVPCTVTRVGTSPTAIIQAGNLEIGSTNGGTSLLTGKIAQAFYFTAKVTQATMQGYISQGLSGTETNLGSAWSFNNSVTDLNTTTPNDLSVGGGSAVATNADTPFGIQASGLASSTLVYGIVQAVTFSTNTTVIVQVPEGNTIPTSGGITAVAYSGIKAPYGMPLQRVKYELLTQNRLAIGLGTVASTWYAGNVMQVYVPVGSWSAEYSIAQYSDRSGAADYRDIDATLSSSSSTETDALWTSRIQVGVISSIAAVAYQHTKSGEIDQANAGLWYGLLLTTGTTTTHNLNAGSYIRMRNAYV